MEPLLSVRGLRTSFILGGRQLRAVDGLSYDLRRGATTAIVGESGSGKSVHALSILGLLPQPTARVVGGDILFQGRSLLNLTKSELRALRGNRIAMIFQEPMTSLNPVMTVGEQVAEGVVVHQGSSRGKAMARALRLLELVGIPDPRRRLKAYPHEFSGGMRQRVMIAIALSCDPDLLIADEPTTALDVTIQAQILDLLREVQKRFQMGILLITHNWAVVAEMAEEVVVMYAGRQMEGGGCAEIFRSPKHPYTRALLASLPNLISRQERLAAIPGLPPDPREPVGGCPFAPRCPEAFDRCRLEDPPLFNLPGGRVSACWKSEPEATSSNHRYA